MFTSGSHCQLTDADEPVVYLKLGRGAGGPPGVGGGRWAGDRRLGRRDDHKNPKRADGGRRRRNLHFCRAAHRGRWWWPTWRESAASRRKDLLPEERRKSLRCTGFFFVSWSRFSNVQRTPCGRPIGPIIFLLNAVADVHLHLFGMSSRL